MPGLRLDTGDDTKTPPPISDPINLLPPAEEPVPRKRTADPNPYEPLGVRAGGLTLHASLAIGGEMTTNVTNAHTGAKTGFGSTLRPSVSFASDWVRHAWTGSASANLTRYLEHKEMSKDNVSADTAFRLDIRRTTFAEFAASYALDTAANVDSGIVGSEIGEPSVHTLGASAALTHDFGAIQLRGSAGVTQKLYEDVALSGGGMEDNADRDYYEPTVSVRATYADPPLLKPFVEAAWQPRVHNRPLDRNGLKRDSNGLALKAGVALSDDPIWSGELALDYLHRSYADATLTANGAWGVTGTLNWSPTELTKLSLSLGTSLTESTTPGYSGGKEWTARLDATQGLRDNLDLHAGAGVAYAKTATGLDTTYDGTLGLLWKLNRNFAISTDYGFTVLDASEAARSYTEHHVQAGVVLQK